LATIQQSYQKAQFFGEVYPKLEKLLTKKYPNLAELNIATTIWVISTLLGYEPTPKKLSENKEVRLKKIYRDSEIGVKADGSKGSQWVADLCKSVGADEQIHGETSKVGYMDTNLLKKQCIKSIVQDWKAGEYPQLYSKMNGFIPNLSIIDLLMNVSVEEAKTILVPQSIKP